MTIGTFTYFGTYWAGFAGKHETAARCLIAAVAVITGIILVCGGEFLFKLLRAPSALERKKNENYARDLTTANSEKQKLLEQIESQKTAQSIE